MKKVEPLSLVEKLFVTVFVLIAFYFTVTGDWNFAFFTLLMAIIAFMWFITKWLCFIAELLLIIVGRKSPHFSEG